MANEEMKEIVENISNDLVEPLQNDYFHMYNESILFLEELQKIVNKYTNNINNNKISNNLRKEISDLYTSKNIQELNDKNRKLESEIGILQAKFSSQIDRFLGRQITLTIVDENGNILLTDTEQEEEIMGNLSRSAFKDSGRGKMNITKESLDRIKENMKKSSDDKLKELQKAINDSANTKREVFKTAILRFNKDKKMYYYYTQSKKKLYGGKKKTSIADITEKYAMAVVNNDNNINAGTETATKEYSNNIDNSLQYLYLNYISSSRHDSVPALAKGDIKITSEGNIDFKKFQLAIKYKSAHTALIGQYINFANFIVALGPKGNISADMLNEKVLSKIAKKRNIDIEKMGDDKAFSFLKDIKLTT